MSLSGKRFKKVEFKHLTEFLEALKPEDKLILSMLTETAATTCFTIDPDGITWHYKVETPEKVLIDASFALNSEFDYTRPDGTVNKTAFWLEGDTMYQTLAGTCGRSILFERVYHECGEEMTMTVTVDGVPCKAVVIYKVCENLY